MSRKNAHVIKASLVKKVTASKGKLFSVVSTLSSENFNPKKYTLAKYGCKACKTEFAAVEGKEPFCVVCSSTEVDEIESSTKIENIAKVSSDKLASVHCANCKTHNVITLETANMLDTKMHCVECGTEIEYSLDDEDEDLENTDIITDDNDLVDTDDVIPDEETEESEEEISEETEEADLNDNDQFGTDAPEDKTNIDTSIEGKKTKLPVPSEQEKVLTDTNGTDISDEGAGAGKIDLSETDEFDLIDVVEGKLEFARLADTIVATKSGVPVAILNKADCSSEHAGMFHSKGLIQAMQFTTNKDGNAALASFNFTNTKVKLPIPKIVESKVAEQVTASLESANSKQKTLVEDFEQCLQLASVGLNKGFFKGKQNVLKASFIENLQTVGIRNAETLVAKIFAQHSQDYHSVLLETANALMAKSLELRNELAETLGEVNCADDDEEYSETDSFEARLESASINTNKPATKQKVLSSVTASVTDIVHNLKAAKGSVF